MNQNKNLWTFFTILSILCLAGLGFYVFGIYKIISEEEVLAGLYKSIHQEAGNQDMMKNLSRTLDQNKEERDIIDNSFIETKKTAEFLEKLEEIGRRVGAPITVESVDLEGKASLRVDIVASGSFGNIYNLIKAIETFQSTLEFRSFNMNTANITIGKNTTRIWSIRASLKLLSFSEK